MTSRCLRLTPTHSSLLLSQTRCLIITSGLSPLCDLCFMNRLWAEIDLNALKNNVNTAARTVGNNVGILAVVKADAYGHGAVTISRALEKMPQVKMLGVSSVEEGFELRESGVSAPILVMGVAPEGMAADAARAGLTFSVFTEECVSRLSSAAAETGKQVSFHLKVDTGMGRLGAEPENVAAIMEKARTAKNLHFEGVFTHLADSSGPAERTLTQVERFESAVSELARAGMPPRLRHIANSAAVQRFPGSFGNMVRPGIMLYGSSFDPSCLAPVMKVKTSIVRIRKMPAGMPVGYGGTFVTKRPTLLATVPVGYKDGYFRALSGRAKVSVGGAAAPVVGEVCMDFTTIDITDAGEVKAGDEAVLFGDGIVSAGDVAGWARTIPYEVMTVAGGMARKKAPESL